MDLNNSITTYLKNYTRPDFLIQKVHLHFDIHDEHTIVKSILQIQRDAGLQSEFAPLILDGDELTLQSIYIDGKPLSNDDYIATPSQLTIHAVPEKFNLEIEVVIYPAKNTALMGLYQSRANLCTQCEAEGFRRITYFLDRPDVMSYFTTTISADKTKYPVLLSNGNLIEEKNLDNNRHWVHFEDSSLKPCYLFALVAGDFDLIADTFMTMSKRKVALYIYLEKGFLDQGEYAVIALKKSMRWDEERWGREYDLDRYSIVAVSDFNMGAMENKGLNVFNTKYVLAKPATATDTDYINIERVIGHEYFHNWSGNRITCRDWFQLTLKEGLTVFRDQSFTEDMTSKGVARIDVVNTLRNHQFPEDAGPMAHPIRPDNYMKIDNFYTATVYEKGAEVIRMVQTLLTPVVFRKAMDLYFSRYDGQAVTTEDFLSAMHDASGEDLTQFSRWYHQAGTPVLRVKTNYDAAKKEFHITVNQSCPPTPNQLDKLPLHLPFAVGLIGADCIDLNLQLLGSKTISKIVILEITKTEETFTFINIEENPTPSLLREFSAPVEMQYDYTNAQLALLLQCDSDPFCRWEAGQRLLVNSIGLIAKEIMMGREMIMPPILLASFKKLLTHPVDDNNLLARLLQFPSLKYVLTHLPKVDLNIIFSAKQFLENQLATHLEKLFLTTFKKHQISSDYSYNVEDSGHRRLRNQCLYYLIKTHNKQILDVAFHEATQSNNMTDQLGGLNALNDHDVPQREQALAMFYDQYQHEPLVVNKWLALRASSLLPNVIVDVKNLIQHAGFDIKNPNNVYALLVTFGQNTVRFHDINGEGYRFLADQVLIIDAQNPQVSARVVSPLTQWKQMDGVRGTMMKAELKRIAESGKLSENLNEIVSKSLK
ncbi:MAG: aminopeptidase N [Gammaproteobacteria bacterium]|nr:aminopeptidase N [Gammaproteobacteria bacterium]